MKLNLPGKGQLIFWGFILLFCTLFAGVELTNNKFDTNDLRVYYDAVQDYFSGNNPYEENYGLDTGYYKYPPFILYLFSFYKLVSFPVAQIIHTTLLTVSLMLSIPMIKKVTEEVLSDGAVKRNTWMLYAIFFSVAIHLVRELHMGNINLILLGLFTGGLWLIFQRPQYYFCQALLWSLMIILKPIMILCVIPLVFYRRWKLFFSITGLGLFYFLFPSIHKGWNGNIYLWQLWYQSIAEHGEYIVSENTLRYLSHLYLGTTSDWLPSFFILALLMTGMIVERKKNGINEQSFLVWLVIFCAFIPNFFVTDTEHLLLSVPVIALLLWLLADLKTVKYWIIFSVIIAPFSFNSNDLLGRTISDQYIDRLGLMGISNLLFILLSIFLYREYRKRRN